MNHLSDDEFLIRCLTDNNDPVVRRLCRMVENYQEVLGDVQHLTDSDDGYTIEGRTISEHIRFLDNEIEYLNDEMEALRIKVKKLNLRTVPQLIADLSNKHSEAEQRAYRAEQRERQLEEKLNMWAILNK